MKRHAVLVASAMALAAGCGKKASGPGISIDDAPGEIARAVCPKAYGCCTPMQLAPNDLAGKDEPSCEMKTQKGFKDQLDRLRGAIDAGRVAYHGDRLADCLAYIRGASCMQLDTTNHFTGLACQPYLEPLVAPGGTCGGDAECIDGRCVKTGPESGPGTCKALPKQGEACDDGKCAKDLICDGDSTTCRALVPSGGMCTNDLDCQSASCPDYGSGSRTCAAPAADKCFYASACNYGRAPLGAGVISMIGLLLIVLRGRRS